MIMENALELWDYLEANSGIDFRDRDKDLKAALCEQLKIRSSTVDLALQLKIQNTSIEEFINSFFTVLAPYVQMMRDLCIFFEKNKVIETNEAIRMSFDFGKGSEDLGFDLKQFRESIKKYSIARSKSRIYEFTSNNLWPLWEIFNPDSIRLDKNTVTHPWLDAYNHGVFTSPDIEFPSTGDKELDKLIIEIQSVWKAYVNVCMSYGENLEECSENLRSTMNEKNDNAIRELYFIQSDHWAKGLLHSLLWRISLLENMPLSDRRDEIKRIREQAKAALEDIPVKEQQAQISKEDLLDILKLPFWGKRHILYQSWTLALIYKALSSYNSQVLHSDGVLELKFKATKVIEARYGNLILSVWSELKTPVNNPVGKGRINNIQPDYALHIQPENVKSHCFSVIECKQYKRGNTRNFSQAINDYATGHPNAQIFLINDGTIARSLARQIRQEYRTRSRYWAGIRPGAIPTSDFTTTLTELCDNQIKMWVSEKFELIAIDISGSMIHHLSDYKIKQQIIEIGQSSPNAILISINTTVEKKWPNSSKESIEQLLDLGVSGMNDLSSALAGYDLQKALIITDQDGASQIRLANLQPAEMLVLG